MDVSLLSYISFNLTKKIPKARMPGSAFEKNLVHDVQRRICKYLDDESLIAFALTSKQCRSMASSQLFRKIHLTVRTRKELREDVDHWMHTLESAFSVNYVRELVIEGCMPRRQEDPGINRSGSSKSSATSAVNGNNNSKGRSLNNRRTEIVADNYEPWVALENEDAWMPVVELIQQLPALADLVYNCTNQFPACVLKALHQDRPHCRLHMETFKFRSLNDAEADLLEFALAKSPSLYSISATYDSFDIEAQEDFNEEAILRTIAGLAPNLKEASLFRRPLAASPELELAVERLRKAWQGFSLETETDKNAAHPGSLNRLELFAYGFTREELQTWSKYIDYSTLRILQLRRAAVGEDALSWMAANSCFPSLTALEIQMESFRAPPTDTYFNTFNSFFRSLPPLTTLEVTGNLASTSIEAILEHHGPSLHHFSLSSPSNLDLHSFNLPLLQTLLHHSPHLSTLALPIQRSGGSALEVSLYRTLGSLPALQTLSLTLDSSNPSVIPDDEDTEIPNNPAFDAFDQQFIVPTSGPWGDKPRNGHVREAFINSALDAPLALAIFDVIARSKPANSFALEELTLLSTGGGEFGALTRERGSDAVFRNISRSWKMRRGEGERVVAVEVGVAERERLEGLLGETTLQSNVEKVFRRIWPVRGEGGDWRGDWFGLPLEE